MNLFTEIEGSTLEGLTSKVFRFLLLRSLDVREKVFQLISARSPIGVIILQSHFSCNQEIRTEDTTLGAGRIDFLIETDNAVVGIENKLHAPFQENQPRKYLESLEKRAMELNSIRGKERTTDHMLVILGPKSRSEEIEGMIKSLTKCIFISWEEVLKELSTLQRLDTETEIILLILKSYVEDKISLFPVFEQLFPHLHRTFPNDSQQVFLEKIGQFFPIVHGSRGGTGKNWTGRSFSIQMPQGQAIGWYGFVSKAVIIEDETARETEFVFASNLPFQDLQEPVFKPVKLGPSFHFGPGKVYAWIIKFDKSWSDEEKWRAELGPLWIAIKQFSKNLS